MKKKLEYIGLILLTIFSFYYTDKVTHFINKNDSVMNEILEYKQDKDMPCIEGYIKKEGAVLGQDGLILDTESSFREMSNTFDESKLVFKKEACKVNLNATKDNYILSASKAKKEISIFITSKDIDLLKKILSINNNLSILVDGKTLKDNYNFYNELYLKGYKINYNGNNSEDFDIYMKYINKMNASTYCVSHYDNDIDYCYKKKIHKLKTAYYYKNDIYLNVINNIDNGSFYVFDSNINTLDEIRALIKYLEAKNIIVVNINELIEK